MCDQEEFEEPARPQGAVPAGPDYIGGFGTTLAENIGTLWPHYVVGPAALSRK